MIKQFSLDEDYHPPFEYKGGGFLPGYEIEKAKWLWMYVYPNKPIPKFFKDIKGDIYYEEK